MKRYGSISQTKLGRKLRRSTARLVTAALLITALPLILLFSIGYLKNSVSQMNVISEQLIQQLNLKASNIVSYSAQIPNDKLILTLLSQDPSELNKAKIENRLMELSGYASGVESIVLSCEKGDFHSVFISDRQMEDLLESSWYLELQQKEYLRFFLPPEESSNLFRFFARLDDISSLSGKLIISIRADDLRQLLERADKTFSHYIWLDNQNRPVLNRRFNQEDYLFSLLSGEEKINFFDEYIFFNSSGIFISHQSEVARWKLIAFIPYGELLMPFLPTLLLLTVSMASIMAMAGIVLKPLIHNIVGPIEILSEQMRTFSYDDIPSLEIHTGDEIEELSQAFSSMAKELKKQIDLLLEEHKKEQKMKYGLHISQINPHFIYNTMNTINYLARQKRSEDIIVINSALIHIMKDSLRINETSVFDTVETEVNVTREYLKIQEYRYEEKIEIFWDIAPSILSCMIPKHIIQPLVENAILHGFLEDGFESLQNEPPFIRISVRPWADSGGVKICVEDNGAGIDMEKYEHLCNVLADYDAPDEYSRGKHIGLSNIRWRLNYLLGQNQSLDLCPRLPHGTLVTITLQKS